jgi:uncharacterized membrane protein
MNQIERMNRTRKILLWVTLLGTLVAFEIFTYPLFVSSYVIGGSRRFYKFFPGALLVWSLFVVILLLRPRIAKWKSGSRPAVKSRRRVSPGWTIVSVITFFILIQFLMSRFLGYSGWSDRNNGIGLILWLSICAVMLAVFKLNKNKLKKDPLLLHAVNDERIRMNWFKAYRFGFFVICGLAVLWKSSDWFFSYDQMFRGLRIPQGSFLILFGALISLIGSFLFYNREARDE